MPNRGVISPSVSIEDKRADSARGEDMRYDDMTTKKRELGFTLIELLVAIVVLAILAAIAIPGFSRLLPDRRLRVAARDIYSSMQLAKMGAVRANTSWVIVFNTGSNSYRVCSDDGGDGDWTDGDETVEKTVNLTDYESGVGYGSGNATKNATTAGGALPGDNVSYASPANVVVFNPRGTCNGGYVYLENNKNTTTYAIGTRASGIIRLVKWNSSITDWE
jgi:prepilin-type N-terminal cleavage/methylation domain-containing protein